MQLLYSVDIQLQETSASSTELLREIANQKCLLLYIKIQLVALLKVRPCLDLVPMPGHGARALKWTLFTDASTRIYKCS